ncbi:site-2 protease family protein [Candidatus Pacearchaeota archaeon]|nr:site-2 protease family protein [Candidatus Pacearchaeota archaeon]
MNLIITYDLSFLVIFTLFVIIFLYSKRKNIAREGLLYLYKTQVGVKLIDYIGRKFGKQIRSLHYVIISISYLLFAGIMFIIGQAIYIYLKVPEITSVIKTPPLLPLIPYFPQLFGAKNLFPPFYFVYFLAAIVIVAFVHEFSHGILAKANNVRIKSTGVAFLGPILGAFVEQDEGQMKKQKNVPQMAILGAGVFANTIIALIFFILLLASFKILFAPSGAIFASYSYGIVNISDVTNITNVSGSLLQLQTQNQNFLIDSDSLKLQLEKSEDTGFIVAYLDAPAIRNNISGAITEVNGNEIKDLDGFIMGIEKYSPGNAVIIKTTKGEYNINLGEHPENSSRAFLGVGFRNSRESQKFYTKIFFFKNPNVYYKPLTSFSVFIYDLLWWISIINIMVALFNMLPFGFLDGGRFFYLTVLGITKSEKIAMKSYKIATKLVLILFILLMIAWVISFRSG